ncbi:hypothetical protein [Nannocystis radixulma]|uniref:Uncharacterized protein n=1 Tax=Nannocystis radixulma TaxID=2995305 RepID=A0ABT5B7V8_9BACT|nr:hypothetical protein [Nannocystis radixulma]MDC0670205.1 hypothetical protein [Nannocystis radixulma]
MGLELEVELASEVLEVVEVVAPDVLPEDVRSPVEGPVLELVLDATWPALPAFLSVPQAASERTFRAMRSATRGDVHRPKRREDKRR